MSTITAHVVVKNEDQWVWFAINSVLPYVDKMLITDTGSSDRTVEIIKAIKSPKITFSQAKCYTPLDVTKVRQQQIADTKTDWIWIVDGDEIYPQSTAREIKKLINSKYLGIIVRRYDVLGDVFHYQQESVGTYELHGQKGHFSTRLIKLNQIPDLQYKGDYPWEGFYDKKSQSLHQYSDKLFTFTSKKYWHTTYLKRSSIGLNIANMFNRQKYKIETGFPIDEKLPEIFYSSHPKEISNPLKPRSLIYEILARLITPIKQLKRRLM